MSTILRTLSASPLLDRDAGDRRIWFRLVTPAVDRHGTIILPEGVDLTTHRSNPVFLWMHQSSARGGRVETEALALSLPPGAQPPPDVVIGQVDDYDQSTEHLDIRVLFDSDEMADLCYRKVLGGFLRAVSIGCNVLEESTRDVDGVAVPVYVRTELLEASLVIIPSNRQALALDRAGAAEVLRGLDARDVPAGVAEATAERADPPQAHLGGDVADEDAAVGDDETAAWHDGLMVCLYPIAGTLDGLVVAGGEPAASLHVTLAYVPPDGLPDGWEDRLTVLLRGIADRFPVLRGEVAGVGRFAGSDTSGGRDVVYASPDVPRLIDVASAVQCEMRWAEFRISRRHGWTPHITLAYVERNERSPVERLDPVPVAFDCLSFTAGGVRHDFDFATPDRVVGVADRSTGAPPPAPVESADPAPTPVAAAPEPEPAREALMLPIDRQGAAPYLERDTANQGDSPTAAETRNQEPTMPIKMSPECRWAMRATIAHAMDGAEMHATICDMAPDEHKGMHRGMALDNLKRAEDLHKAYAAAFNPADDEGATRAVPELKDTELKARFAEVAARVGKLPRTPGQVLRQYAGTEHAAEAEVELMALRDDRADLLALRKAQRDEATRTEATRREELIARYVAPEVAIITPATAQQMRGVDPATGQPSAEGAWTCARIETYVQKRMASGAGPAVDITRVAPLRSADPNTVQPASPTAPLQPATAVPTASGQSRVRVMSAHGGGDATRRANEALQHIPGLTAEELQRSISVLSANPGVQPFAEGVQKINVK